MTVRLPKDKCPSCTFLKTGKDSQVINFVKKKSFFFFNVPNTKTDLNEDNTSVLDDPTHSSRYECRIDTKIITSVHRPSLLQELIIGDSILLI